jgi:hypothetical protein
VRSRSATTSATAAIVSEGFTPSAEGTIEPSTTKRFGFVSDSPYFF